MKELYLIWKYFHIWSRIDKYQWSNFKKNLEYNRIIKEAKKAASQW